MLFPDVQRENGGEEHRDGEVPVALMPEVDEQDVVPGKGEDEPRANNQRYGEVIVSSLKPLAQEPEQGYSGNQGG